MRVCVCTYTYIHIYIYIKVTIIYICYICILKISSDQDAQVPESPPVAPSSKQGVHFYGYQRPCMFISMESKSSLKMEEKHRKNQIIAICLYMWIRKITVNTMDFEVVPHPPKKNHRRSHVSDGSPATRHLADRIGSSELVAPPKFTRTIRMCPFPMVLSYMAYMVHNEKVQLYDTQ